MKSGAKRGSIFFQMRRSQLLARLKERGKQGIGSGGETTGVAQPRESLLNLGNFP
jgi:hypothetical protein